MLINKLKQNLLVVACIVIAILSVIIRTPNFDNEDFYNSDATWHVLHTIRCYDETPFAIHKFLPIVTLGDESDKNITWGATIPDKYGNYYYTSFSPAGFAAPYFFMKIFQLPLSLNGLYVFNSALYILCFILCARLFIKLFPTIKRDYIWFFITAVYLFQPEIMHGQGLVYWSQSLYQAIFFGQLILLLDEKKRGDPKMYGAALLLCVFAAYTEWTGYLANIGIACALFLMEKGRARYTKSAGVALATFAAGAIFCAHYLTTVNAQDFTRALINRFTSRNFTSSVSLDLLAKGYAVSFGLLICALIFIVAYVLTRQETRERFAASLKSQRFIIIISLFAVMENFIMKQHAIAYSYDRIKAILLIITIILCAVESLDNAERLPQSLLAALFVAAVVNLYNYKILNNNFVWSNPNFAINRVIFKDMNEKFAKSNSIMVYKNAVRGYINTMTNRGVYESSSLEAGIKLAEAQNKLYAVELLVNVGYDYYDLISGEYVQARYENGKMTYTDSN